MNPGASEMKPSRKRASLACNGCRSKRTKCDGSVPVCGACTYRQQHCEYTQAESNRKRPSNAYVMALEARVATLEQKLAAVHAHKDGIESDSGGGLHDSSCPNYKQANVPGIQKRQEKEALREIGDAPATGNDADEKDEPVDSLVDALGCFTLGEAGELHYFGASSNFTIVQDHSHKVPSSIDARQRGYAAARQMPGFFDPPDELRDELLAIFWRWQNSWQYIVPREAFVHDLYVDKSGRFCTPLLLSSVLALASRYSSRPELRLDVDDSNTAGEVFAAQARTMLHYEYEAPTTSTVQATALLGLYGAAVDNEGLGFMYIGMASRMAMNLGLHSDCSPYVARGLISEEDVEVCNITFWGIYVLDKLYCLGMGRPASIQEYNITTTKPKANVCEVSLLAEAQATISSPFPTSHITENFICLSELFIATSEVIDQMYAQRSSWTEGERKDRVMKAHLQAAKLFNRLPKSLKISNSSLQPSPPYVYQFHLQYHHSILLLHRPFFRLLYQGKNSIEYDPEGKDIHSRSCRTSAVKISRIFQIFRNNFTNRCMPISAVHPAFTAAIIHLLHVKEERLIKSNAGRTEAVRCLSNCIRSLYEMNINWEWACRSIRAIQSLADQWGVDIWAHGLRRDIDDENWKQFKRYESSCRQFSKPSDRSLDQIEPDFSADTLEDVFDMWAYEQSLLNLPFTGLNDLFS